MMKRNIYNVLNYYWFGFQGQLLDDDIKGDGNSVNYKYRMSDPRVGRFFAIDPLSDTYPYYSSYAFSGNRVIDCYEREGLEPEKKATGVGVVEQAINKKDGKIHNFVGRANGTWFKGSEVTGPSAQEALQLSEHVYTVNDKNHTLKVAGWDFVYADKGDPGFKSALYKKEICGKTFYTLAFAGTDDFKDVVTDVRAGLGATSAAYSRAVVSASVADLYIKDHGGGSLTYTGHSLGGGMASLISLIHNHHAITFNAAGLHKDTKRRWHVQTKIAKIDAYVIEGEAVDYLQRKHTLKAEGDIHKINPSTSYFTVDSYALEQGLSKYAAAQMGATFFMQFEAALLMQRVNNHLCAELKIAFGVK